MKVEYDEWLERMKAAGESLTSYCCPNQECGADIHALVPPKGDVYDSLVSCHLCGTCHFKTVKSDGSVELSDYQGEALL